MDREARGELVVVLAGLVGIVLGHVTRRLVMTPSQRARARFTGLGAPSLVAAPALGRAIGDASGVGRDRIGVQALLAFTTGAALAFFAEEVGRHVPGLPDPSDTGQR